MYPPTPLGLLKQARDLISDESRWTKFVMARDADGRGVSVHQTEAVRFCAIGALLHVAPPRYWRRLQRALEAFGDANMTWINDSCGHGAVLALYDEAIAGLEAQP